jgi:hypothetical protein
MSIKKSKSIKLKVEIHGEIEEILEEYELDITSLVYAEATVVTETMNENSERGKH